MSYSLTGAPAQDASYSNVGVKQNISAINGSFSTVSTLNLETAFINGVSSESKLKNIYSVFTGEVIGVFTLCCDIYSIDLGKPFNLTAGTLPANTVFGYVDGYRNTEPITYELYLFCPGAPNLTTAIVSTSITLHEDGTMTSADAVEVPDFPTGQPTVPPRIGRKGGGMSID